VTLPSQRLERNDAKVWLWRSRTLWLDGRQVADNLAISGMTDENVSRHSYPRHLARQRKLRVTLRRHAKRAVRTCHDSVRVLDVACGDDCPRNRLMCASIDNAAARAGMVVKWNGKDAAAKNKTS
jgi:hypothetical protein